MEIKTKKKDRATKVEIICPFCGMGTEYLFRTGNSGTSLLNRTTLERIYPRISDEIRMLLFKKKEFHFTDTCHNCCGIFEIEIRGD